MSDRSELEARIARLEHRAATLEDANDIRKLHYAYGYYIDKCMYDEVVQLFAKDGEVTFLSGVYTGHEGIARLYCTWFRELFTAGRNGPVDGFLLDHIQMQDVVTVADDRLTARARFRALLPGGPHDSFPRKEQVPGQFWEAGIYENDYVREDGIWKIRRLDYVLQWQSTYEDGWAFSEAHLAPATVCYPENPLGPDYIMERKRKVWPGHQAVPTHYPHPVTGAPPAAAE